MKGMKYWILICFLFVIACNDLKYRRIPNKMLSWFLGAGGILLLAEGLLSFECKNGVTEILLGAFTGAIPFLVCYLFSKRRIGGGDVKLMAVAGMFTGAEAILEILFCSLCFALCFYLWCFLKKKKDVFEIPFAPFLLAGTITMLLLNAL